MKTPTSAYRMSRQTKRILSTMLDSEERSVFKRYMIDAELTAAIREKPKAKADQAETKE